METSITRNAATHTPLVCRRRISKTARLTAILCSQNPMESGNLHDKAAGRSINKVAAA